MITKKPILDKDCIIGFRNSLINIIESEYDIDDTINNLSENQRVVVINSLNDEYVTNRLDHVEYDMYTSFIDEFNVEDIPHLIGTKIHLLIVNDWDCLDEDIKDFILQWCIRNKTYLNAYNKNEWSDSMKKANVFVDGANRNNQGNTSSGGWGAVFLNSNDEIIKEMCGGELDTTNNRMEMKAIIKALQYVKDKSKSAMEINLHTDSNYCKQGITDWMHGWIKRGWKGSNGKEVKNIDLWKEINNLINHFEENGYVVNVIKVKGHSGDKWNDYADMLANKGVDSL